nr:hypothetical protein [Tanacetum cinerariifolium]
MAQNIDFSGFDQIQTPQYPEVHSLSQEKSKEYSKPENPNELFQKLLEDLKELAEYENPPSKDRPIFLNEDEYHYDQNKECFENSSDEIVASNPNEEKEGPPQDSDIHQLIDECSVEVSEVQKQSMEDTMLELVKIYRQKELLCIHDNVDDLIESALNSKLLLINSQRLDKKEQEVKNVVEQPVEHTSQISSVHAIAPILSTEEPEHSLSMGYEHLSITHETESDEVTESNAKNLLPIPSECEVTSEDESERDVPAKDESLSVFTTFSNPLFKDNDDITSSDDESLPDEDVSAEEFKVYSNPLFDEDEINSDKLDLHCFNVESDFVESLLNRDTFIDSSSKFDFSGELAHVNPKIKEANLDFEEEIRLIENLLYDNLSPRPPKELNEKIADTIVESIPSLPIPVQDNDSQREEIDIVTSTNNVLPPGVENDDSEGEIDAIDDLHADNSILNSEHEYSESEESDFDDPSIPRPPPEPPDAEFDFEPDAEKEIPVVMNEKDEFDVSNEENDDYFPFMFIIRIFLPYLICSKMFLSFISVESEDTIFDP